MERNDAARAACYPTRGGFGDPVHGRNDQILTACGLSKTELRELNARSEVQAVDSLVLLCRERGVANIDALLT